MAKNNFEIDIGFVITKAPLESSIVTGVITLAKHAIDKGKTVGIFLISDGVWIGKKNQKNGKSIADLIEKCVEVIISKDHLEASGIQQEELLGGISITEKPYTELVEQVMEKWHQVITI